MKRSWISDWIEEAEIVASLADDPVASNPVLVDVGAHYGTVTTLFLDKGWSVVAYEPDPANREQFLRNVDPDSAVQLSTAAVSDKAVDSASFFTSSVSTGVSTLSAFHESHEATADVQVVTLAEDLRRRQVSRVDFLKIDIEGFDFFALKGFDWTYRPRFVLYEFEDRKTAPLGYSLDDSGAYMTELGYHLVYSVWEPIIEYGTRHHWRGLSSAPPPDASACWGNVLCFRERSDAQRCLKLFGSRWHRVLTHLAHG
ncbi:MAG: FkbM family methyltransferase [Mycobacterium sp.]|nr:FkbM family methyltransferase [Mycobacterium sp.]